MGISGMNSQAEAFAHFLNLCCEHIYEYTEGRFVDQRPYFNCRERGFVITIHDGKKAKSFAWFEHRNSDELCVVEWDSPCYPPHGNYWLCDDIPEASYKTKWDVTKSFRWGRFGEAAVWLSDRMNECFPKQEAA